MAVPTPSLPAPVAAKHFDLDEANRSLPYVRRVVDDVVKVYRDAAATQKKLEYPLPDQDVRELESHYERSMHRLHELVEELENVGVELKDYDLGLVDFPAWHEGREVCLCWRLGEEQVAAWHEMEDGYAGRQAIDMLD